MSNDYKLINISNINLHIGNGAKNQLKSELALLNFKFFYKIQSQYKHCSSGFDSVEKFLNFIKPIDSYYYIYEYIFESKPCCPYFDYEFELDKPPTKKQLDKYLLEINSNIKKIFEEIFNIKLNKTQIKILSSHGFKPCSNQYKISFHIIIKGYYFKSNKECEYVCGLLKELDDSFDISVYSKDRLMRTYGSAKIWNDNRVLIGIDEKTSPDINKLPEYLITLIEPNSIKLKCPREIKISVEKKKYTRKYVDKQNKPDEIGSQIEQLVKSEYHEDSYFTKSIVNENDQVFYGFNYTNRKQKCFTGFVHDSIGFYCWVDKCSNVLLKCFSKNCQGCRKIIGNLNKSDGFELALKVDSQYLNNSSEVMKLLKQFEKILLVKSQMGTGKSELISNYLDTFKPERVLWISVRQTYSTNIKERFKDYGFINYLDDKENFMYKNKIIVQLESLSQLEKNHRIRPFDLVILDEIESILYHFDSSTIAHKSSSTFDLLYMLCKSAKTKIIGLDADLSTRSIEYSKDLDPNYKLIINNYKKSDIVISLTDNKDWWIGEIKKAVESKLNCCVIGLSTKLLYQIDELLGVMEISKITHTRDSDDKFKKELANVNTFWTKYQVVLYSPTITVGVDFTNLHFDKVFSIISPNTASPRTFKQMLGRLRNLKSNEIISFYQNVSTRTDSILYNYNEMIGYFKYVDIETKTNKKYILKEDSSLEVINGIGLYDRIQMHNRIENLNKSSDNFITQFNLLCEDSNYSIQFLSKQLDKKKRIELDDNVYRNKILSSPDINSDDYEFIHHKILNNKASEEEKFSLSKYKFKTFWDLKQVDEKSLELYFRCEHTLNRLLYIFDKPIKNIDEFIDSNVEKKTKVIKNIIKTLGFDLEKLDKKIPREEYYQNVLKLFGDDNEFKKDYSNIRILFDKTKHELKPDLKGHQLSKLLNGFLNEFGIILSDKRSWSKEKVRLIFFKISIDKKYINKI